MTYKFARIALVLILAVALIAPAPLALACGPDLTGPTFVATTGPDFPPAEYERGKLELLQPTYWHEPLYVAYRNLSGKPFSAAELAAFSEPSTQQNAAVENWVEAWKQARSKVAGNPSQTQQQMYSDGLGVTRISDRTETFLQYYNCLDSAFENAVQTLDARIKQFGAESTAVKNWVAAQDAVFENCSGGFGYPPKPKPAVLPAAASERDPLVIRADREYQIAAAHFYAGDFAAAQSAFERIANDFASPYRKLAPYLIARTLVRRGTLNTGDVEFDPQALGQGEKQLQSIVADKNLAEMHAPAQRLLGFVRIRLRRQERFQELERALQTTGDGQTFRQDLTDYLWLLDHPVLMKTVTPPGQLAERPAQKAPEPDEATRLKPGDMTDWIFTFQTGGAYAHALERWQQTRSLPWLVAAIAKAGANEKAAAQLTAAAEKIGGDSPAYVTVTFHRLRLLEQSGRKDETRRQLDELLARRGSTLSLSAKNEFLALRMKLSRNAAEFLQFAPRTSNDLAAYPNPPEGNATTASTAAKHFDSDASVIFTEKLPLRMLAEAAKNVALPNESRREVAIAAWTRAILLNDETTAKELAPTVAELEPEARDTVTSYTAATDAASRRFAAVFGILRNPGFRPFVTAGYTRGNLYTVGEPGFDKIDNLRDNWWCAFKNDNKNQGGEDYYRMYVSLSTPLREIYADGRIEPQFLTEGERAEAEKELATLDALPAAPNWLGKIAVDWAAAHPDDPRVPEALYLAVRARRFGCPDSSAENYSKDAFTLLHKKYANSQWATKTPYWFQ